MRRFAWIALPAGLLLMACSSPKTAAPADAAAPPPAAQAPEKAQAPAEEAAVLDAVRTYLVEVRQMDVGKMSLGVKDLKVDGDAAACTVDFGLKEAPGAPAMSYAYSLARKEGRWSVVGSRPADGVGHGATPSSGAPMPGGHPPVSGGSPHGMAAGHAESNDLPPGHPPVAEVETQAPAK